MNPAQKRIWWTFSISLLTLIAAGIVIKMVYSGHIDLNNYTVYRIAGIFATIPLILFVLIDKFYPRKVCDERDLLIERKAILAGTIGTFVFMGLAAFLLMIQDFEGTIKRKYLCSFVYLLVFLWNLCSSIVGIAYYYFINPSKKYELQGDSK